MGRLTKIVTPRLIFIFPKARSCGNSGDFRTHIR